jgi:hypothetical protein
MKMKFDLSKFPVAEDDTQLKDEKGNLANYRTAFMKAFVNDFDENGQPIRGEEKFKRFDMWQKFKKAIAKIDLTAEEITFSTKAARDAFPILIAGQCRDFLTKPEPDDLPPG